jgi:hypothetical protein
MIWPRTFFCLLCLWSSAWISLGLSCNGYVDITLMYVQFGEFIYVCNLQCQFIPLHATKTMEVVEAERHLFLVSALKVSSQLQISLICLGETSLFSLKRKALGPLTLSARFGVEKSFFFFFFGGNCTTFPRYCSQYRNHYAYWDILDLGLICVYGYSDDMCQLNLSDVAASEL